MACFRPDKNRKKITANSSTRSLRHIYPFTSKHKKEVIRPEPPRVKPCPVPGCTRTCYEYEQMCHEHAEKAAKLKKAMGW